nr:sigma-70 family RNA polymerase sigma factor [Candidatus Hydrogenedentota bacterium]
MSTNDTALLQRWTRHRDADAFTELVDRHGGMVYGACRRVLGDIHEAQDAAQESFMELMRAPHAITASLPGWLHTVAVRRSLDRIKQSQRRRQREEAFAARAGAAAEAAPDDLLAVVDEAIAAQPDLYRVPIVLRFLEGRTHAEIGAQLGVAESTVRHRIEKGVE